MSNPPARLGIAKGPSLSARPCFGFGLGGVALADWGVTVFERQFEDCVVERTSAHLALDHIAEFLHWEDWYEVEREPLFSGSPLEWPVALFGRAVEGAFISG